VVEFLKLIDLSIDGFRLFKEFRVNLGALEVIVGANGSGKSSVIDFLSIFKKGMEQEIPPGIILGGVGQQVFRSPDDEYFDWRMEIAHPGQEYDWVYKGRLTGPKGSPTVSAERVFTTEQENPIWLSVDHGQGGHVVTADPEEGRKLLKLIDYPNRLSLSLINSPNFGILYYLKEYIGSWRFFRSFYIANAKIKRPVLVEQAPYLQEDCGNLSSVLHFFVTEHPDIRRELEQVLRLVIPGFASLTVGARGGPGEVMAFWREEGVDADLTLADLSDGILRFLCWAVLCLHPKPPTLICIDEPELGLHPRVLPLLAGLFKKASERTQIILATHSSYFLSQFPLENIAVMRKEDGRAVWIKPADHQVFRDILSDFGQDEISHLHISGELEGLA
jgi:predicted ATPase